MHTGFVRCSFKTGYASSYGIFVLASVSFVLADSVKVARKKSILRVKKSKEMWISPRPISIRQLHALPRFHTEPINLIVYEGSYQLDAVGSLILEGASRLDAFSAYPVRTWLPSCAPGGTTGAPAVRPSRSSRTKDSSPQTSCARDR
jgi:hypothetical protein